MPFKDNNKHWCGYLDWLHSTDFQYKVRRFVMLKEEKDCTLALYFTNFQKGEQIRKLDMEIHLQDISAVRRNKGYTVEDVFYLIVNGYKMFLVGENEGDTQEWCDLIQAKILFDGSSGSSHKSPASPLGNPFPHNKYDFSSCNVIKTGFCKKMCGKGFIFLKRFLVLTADGLSYFTCDSNIKGFIGYEEILTCRESNGVYPNRKELFEIVTRTKVYYCQVETKIERKEWIKCFNSNNNCNKDFSFKKTRNSSVYPDD